MPVWAYPALGVSVGSCLGVVAAGLRLRSMRRKVRTLRQRRDDAAARLAEWNVDELSDEQPHWWPR